MLRLIRRVGELELQAPRDRDGRFSSELFERYHRSERVLPRNSVGWVFGMMAALGWRSFGDDLLPVSD